MNYILALLVYIVIYKVISLIIKISLVMEFKNIIEKFIRIYIDIYFFLNRNCFDMDKYIEFLHKMSFRINSI